MHRQVARSGTVPVSSTQLIVTPPTITIEAGEIAPTKTIETVATTSEETPPTVTIETPPIKAEEVETTSTLETPPTRAADPPAERKTSAVEEKPQPAEQPGKPTLSL